jgi:hypothetical protein
MWRYADGCKTSPNGSRSASLNGQEMSRLTLWRHFMIYLGNLFWNRLNVIYSDVMNGWRSAPVGWDWTCEHWGRHDVSVTVGRSLHASVAIINTGNTYSESCCSHRGHRYVTSDTERLVDDSLIDHGTAGRVPLIWSHLGHKNGLTWNVKRGKTASQCSQLTVTCHSEANRTLGLCPRFS